MPSRKEPSISMTKSADSQMSFRNLLNIIVQKLLPKAFNIVLSKLIVAGCLHTHRVRKDLSISCILINCFAG